MRVLLWTDEGSGRQGAHTVGGEHRRVPRTMSVPILASTNELHASGFPGLWISWDGTEERSCLFNRALVLPLGLS